jgi:hypothetical protein
MEMKVTFADPFLIFIYSFSLLLMGDAVGVFWRREPVTAFSIALLGAASMVLHDSLMTVIWCWIIARWMQSVSNRHTDKSANLR